MIRLSDISEVRIGYTFRGAVEPDSHGDLLVLQSKDLSEAGWTGVDKLVRTHATRLDERALLTAGDVVLQSRGACFPAVAVRPDLAGALVASPLYLIRPDQSRVDPAYLATALNAPAVQAGLRAAATGSYIPQLPADAIRDLRLPLPPLPQQRAIAALADLAREEARLAAALAAQRSVWLHALAVHREAQEPKRNSRGHANAPG